ncbi:RuBisCO-associated protein [Senna tora]|uniref:RuBisCO-associated protein n=1 Tax=Senna tora TaxID=362788 RepID=A0A834WA78_9FABA|nr:RuBisCO-associated protein [Senna tora]
MALAASASGTIPPGLDELSVRCEKQKKFSITSPMTFTNSLVPTLIFVHDLREGVDGVGDPFGSVAGDRERPVGVVVAQAQEELDGGFRVGLEAGDHVGSHFLFVEVRNVFSIGGIAILVVVHSGCQNHVDFSDGHVLKILE